MLLRVAKFSTVVCITRKKYQNMYLSFRLQVKASALNPKILEQPPTLGVRVERKPPTVPVPFKLTEIVRKVRFFVAALLLHKYIFLFCFCMWGVQYFFNHLSPAVGQTSPDFQRCCDFVQILSYSFHLSYCCHLQFLSLHSICGKTALLESFSKSVSYSVSFCSSKSAPL
jgi:hypothetical protein